MKKIEAITYTVPVTAIGERIHFQLLPPKGRRLIAFEYGAIVRQQEWLANPSITDAPHSLLAIVPGKVMGRLTLQVPAPERIFYQGDLVEYRRVSQEPVAGVLWTPTIYSHGRKREELSVHVEKDRSFIEGHYIDLWWKQECARAAYDLHLYFWMEK